MADHSYRKSTFCNGGGCVEVSFTFNDQHITVRNSTKPDTELEFTNEEWVDFLDGVKAGEFDG